MSNEQTRDLINFISAGRTQSGLTLLDELYQAHPPRAAHGHAGAIGAQLAVFVPSSNDFEYVDIEASSHDNGTAEGTILAITASLVLKLTFRTPNNVYEPAEVLATARRRSTITAVSVSGATSPTEADEPWPTQVEVKVIGDGWTVVFPGRRNRDDALGKLIPSLLA